MMMSPRGLEMTFAEKMAELRGIADLTQGRLSELTGIALPTIRKMEQGATSTRINFSFVVALATVLKVPVDEFAQCDDVKYTPAVQPTKKPAATGKAKKGR